MAKDRSAEALELSEEILRNFELNEIPTQNIVLKCLRLARLTNDIEGIEWLRHEAHGFDRNSEGRLTEEAWKSIEKSGRYFYVDDDSKKTQPPTKIQRSFTETIAVMEASIASLSARMAVSYDPNLTLPEGTNYSLTQRAIQGNNSQRHAISKAISEQAKRIETVRSRLYDYVSNINYELKFGEITENVFSRKRKFVDNALKDISPESIQKFISVYENLQSKNDEDWANAVHTCRRIIKEVADVLYPPSNDLITLPGGKKIQVGEEQYINRLIQYISNKSESGSFEAIVGSHLKFIGERLDSIHNAANKGTHTEVTLEEAERYIIYTYLIIGDILSL